MSFQKCPVCDGTGLVSRPPWVAGDVQTWTDSSGGPYPCKVCGGQGILSTPDDWQAKYEALLDHLTDKGENNEPT